MLPAVGAEQQEKKVCWWHMSDGKVLGVHDGLIVEYDAETLSPLGNGQSRASSSGLVLILPRLTVAVID